MGTQFRFGLFVFWRLMGEHSDMCCCVRAGIAGDHRDGCMTQASVNFGLMWMHSAGSSTHKSLLNNYPTVSFSRFMWDSEIDISNFFYLQIHLEDTPSISEVASHHATTVSVPLNVLRLEILVRNSTSVACLLGKMPSIRGDPFVVCFSLNNDESEYAIEPFWDILCALSVCKLFIFRCFLFVFGSSRRQ